MDAVRTVSPLQDTAPRPDRFIGIRLGRYVVEKKLGEGGFGAVYRVRHVDLPDTHLALKILTLPLGGDAATKKEFVDRFLQEARAAAAVGSHRVVQVVDVGQLDDGTHYLLMEYVPGRSLAQALAESGPMGVRSALLVCARVADTLALAHQRGIIHRDIKPQNLMLLEEGLGTVDGPSVKILDFGIARATGEAKVVVTLEKRIVGTPGYMSPEAVVGAVVDGRTDVWSLAATLFEMLTGRLPLDADSFQKFMLAAIQSPVPRANDLRPSDQPPIPEEIEAVLAWGLTKDPLQRPTMAEFRSVLVRVAEIRSIAERRNSGPVLASVMRRSTPSSAERPTLSAGAAEASEILARYSTPAPVRATTETRPRTGRRNSVGAAISRASAVASDGVAVSPVSGTAASVSAVATSAEWPRKSAETRTWILVFGLGLLLAVAAAVAVARWAPSRPSAPVISPGAPAGRPLQDNVQPPAPNPPSPAAPLSPSDPGPAQAGSASRAEQPASPVVPSDKLTRKPHQNNHRGAASSNPTNPAIKEHY